MNTGTLVGGIVDRGRKTKLDGDSSSAKEFTLDGPKVKNGVLLANTCNFWALTNDQWN